MIKMKKCPFCGAEPKTCFSTDESLYDHSVLACIDIVCNDCGVSLHQSKPVKFFSETNPGDVFMEIEKQAADRWNHRIR